MYTVLVCDDDRAILDSIGIYLTNDGYDVLKAEDGLQALELVRSREIHCLILDVMMPRLDGIQTLLALRRENNIPVILLSAKSEDTDKITGLSFGADDYVTKPFNSLELLARVRSQIRRYTRLGAMTQETDVLVTGGLTLNEKTCEVCVDGEPVTLTKYEFGVLRHLMRHPGQVFTTAQIYEAVWNEPAYCSARTVTQHISKLRAKIEINSRDPKYLKAVYGLGYKIEKY